MVAPPDNQFVKILPTLINGFAANILAYAALLATVATLTMAILELIKGVFGLRLIYQKAMVKMWIAKNGKSENEIYDQLVVLSVSDITASNALFNQPSEKMMGEIQAAANIAMDFPNIYPDMYYFLTKTSEVPSIKKSQADSPASDAELWKNFSAVLDSKAAIAGTPNPEMQAATQARARLDHFVTRKLDAFQTRIDFVWARWNQIIAVTGSTFLIGYFLLQIDGVKCYQIILPSIFGGLIAPFAKDMVTALSGIGGGSK